MSKEIIREEIDIIMETIVEQWETIRAYEGKIPLIEMDIFMGNIRKLYDDLYLLDKMNKAPGFNPEKIKSQITREPSVSFEPESGSKPEIGKESDESSEHIEQKPELVTDAEPEPEMPSIDFRVNDSIEEPVLSNQEHSSSQSEPATEEAPDIAVETESFPQSETEKKEEFKAESEDEPVQPTIEIKTAEPEKEVPRQPAETTVQKKPVLPPAPDLFGSTAPSLADKYQVEKKSVKDQLAENGNDNSLGNKMQQSQITDLKSAIGINDKFLFINELFKGDLAGYNRTIESLNLCHSRQEAIDILDEMRLKYNWSDNSSSFLRLTEFLKRRYAV
jgi:hypothetical protein